ncbi:Cystatin [Crotalus adamanteus]|uniref:Cystatin n=1 Tax=Crotalus adamanteus TaxID=8729 RepID=A0AAW1AND9_CROAD
MGGGGENLGRGDGPATEAGLLGNGRGLCTGKIPCHLRLRQSVVVQANCWDCSLCVRACQTVCLSLNSPMMHSQMPVRSLLCALLMLPLGMPQGLSYMPIPRAVVPILAAFPVQQYNKDRNDSRTYFKIAEILYTKSPVCIWGWEGSISLNKAIVMTFRLVFLSCPNPIQSFRFHGNSTMTPRLVQESLQPFGVLSKLLETLICLTVFKKCN